MAKLIINGQQKISGTFTPLGNKNAALPMLAACLLTDQPVTLHNVPAIKDVQIMLELLSGLGVSIEQHEHSITLQAASLQATRLNPERCGKVRSSILLAGPLTARHGKATLFPPGGDVIGRRRLDSHFLGLKALGMSIEITPRYYTFSASELIGCYILLDEASVTATENILMAACLAKGRTTIYNAACEPHVSDLADLLTKMGASIEGAGTNRIIIHGKSHLGGATHRVGPDYIEAGSFAAAAAVTGGELVIPDTASTQWLPVMQQGFARLGAPFLLQNNHIHLPAANRRTVQKDFTSEIPKIEDGPWPAFPSDLISVAIVLATQTHGTTLFFEKMFESRLYFVDHLISMGAQIVQCDPHRVVVIGPAQLHASHMSSPDIRAGMALLIAALCAEGQSIIENAQMIDRGYEHIDKRLRDLGADITRIP